MNELALPNNERFSLNRLLLLLFEQMTADHDVSFTISSVDDVPDHRGEPGAIGLLQAIRDLANNVGYRGMERLIWNTIWKGNIFGHHIFALGHHLICT